MIVKTFVLLLGIHCITAATVNGICQTQDDCKCQVWPSGAFLQWHRQECNQCVLLGIENTCNNEPEIDPNTFQLGFWVPALGTINQDTVAVVKIKKAEDDILNKNLVIRGFNTPEYQGCRRTSPTTADYAWSTLQTPASLVTHHDSCDAAERMWFFNVHVHASHDEISTNKLVDLEFSVGGNIHVTTTRIPLTEEVVNPNTAMSFSSRGLNQIHTFRTLPREIVLDVKKFGIDCGSAATCAYEGAYIDSFTIDVGMQYTITRVNENLQINVVTGCTINNIEDLGEITTFVAFTSTTPCAISIKAYVSTTECTAGQTGVGCSACVIGKFKSNAGSVDCTECASGATTIADSRVARTACFCQEGYRGNAAIDGGSCTVCDAGKYSDGLQGSTRTCVDCNAGKYSIATGASVSSVCVDCPPNSATTGAGKMAVGDCICNAGYKTNGEVCDACGAGKYSGGLQGSTRTCVDCNAGKFSTATIASSDQTCSNCVAPTYQDGAGSSDCKNCPANSGTIGDMKTSASDCTCNSGYVTDTTTGACIILITGGQETQTVTLYTGTNYFSLWVFPTSDLKISDMLNNIQNIKVAVVSVYHPSSLDPQTTAATLNGAEMTFPQSDRLHFKKNVYIATIEFKTGFTTTSFNVHGNPVPTLDNFGLIVGTNWLPMLSDMENTAFAMPIQTQCISTPCFNLKYVTYDRFIRYGRNTIGNVDIRSGQVVFDNSNSISRWDFDIPFNKGQVSELSLIPVQGRDLTFTDRIMSQLNNLDSVNVNNLRVASYSNAGRRRLLSVASSSTTNHRRLLSAFVVSAPAYCADTTSCECQVTNANANAVSIPWPRDQCNSCVLNQAQACDRMGETLTLGAATFVIYAKAPAGVRIDSTSIAVAKLKRSFLSTTSIPAVKFEHLSIRSSRYAIFGGCMETAGPNWDNKNCAEAEKVYIFSLPMNVMGSELVQDNPVAALRVNFEIDINGVKYVTPNEPKLSSVGRTSNNQMFYDPYFAKYLTETYILSEQKFQIVCPFDRSLMDIINSICPFEGQMPNSILIYSSSGNQAMKFFDPTATSNVHLVGSGIQIRQIKPTSTTFSIAPTNNMSYVIRRMPNVRTYVTIHEAVFETCSFRGAYKQNADGTLTCDPDRIGIGNVVAISNCENPFFTNKGPIAQNDNLYVTTVSGDRTSRTTTTYNNANMVHAPTVSSEYILSNDDEFLEIDVIMDAYECSSSSTRIHITIDIVSNVPVVAVGLADRLDALADSVQTCARETGCECKVEGTNIDIAWPVDECNNCVLRRSTNCNLMGQQFVQTGMVYNLYADNTEIVNTDTIVVGKLKNSRMFDSNIDLKRTGVQYPHLCIRSIAPAVCYGCFENGRVNVASWGVSHCSGCPDNLKIFFFQLTVRATNNGEIVANGVALPAPLQVNFEFSVNGILYVTQTTKPLANAMTVGGSYINVHNTPVTLVNDPADVVWPLKVDINRKLFGVICPVEGHACPYEGNNNNQLVISQNSIVQHSNYSFRMVPGENLNIKLDEFNLNICSQPAIYEDVQCDPSNTGYYGDDMASYLCNGPTQEASPQTDSLRIVHYTVATKQRKTYTWSPGNSATTGTPGGIQEWALTNAGDLLEIEIINDGYNCAASNNNFDMRFTIQTTPVGGGTPPAPQVPTACPAGKEVLGSATECTPCLGHYIKTGIDTGPCIQCPLHAIADSGKISCSCVPATHTTIISGNVLTCQPICIAGQYRNTAGTCTACSATTFKANPGDGICGECAPGNTVTNAGTQCTGCTEYKTTSISSASCACKTGFTETSGVCSCPAGRGIPSSGSNCETCPVNTFKGSTGFTACTTCSVANAGVNQAKTACECASGYTAASADPLTCSQNLCNPGYYKLNTVCTICAPGSMVTTLTTCEACTSYATTTSSSHTCTCPSTFVIESGTGISMVCTCAAGFGLSGASCQPCIADTFKDVAGTSACTQCHNSARPTPDRQGCKCLDTEDAAGTGSGLQCTSKIICTGNTEVLNNACQCRRGFSGSPCTACPPGTFKNTVGDGACATCGVDHVSQSASTENSACTSCQANSAPATARDRCVCNTAGGWEPTGQLNVVAPACSQVEETINSNFQLDIEFNTFTTTSKVDTFKVALATVYKTEVAKIELTVYAFGTIKPTTSNFRRRLLTAAAQSGTTIIEAEIKRWRATLRPADDAINTGLGSTGYTVTKLADDYVAPIPGSTPNSTHSPTPKSTGDSMWIIFVCVGGGLLVMLVGAIVCIQHYKAQNAQMLPLEDAAPDITQPSRAETVFVPIPQYNDHNYHSLFVDPHV